MSEPKKRIYSILGCETRFYKHELKLLRYFFNCQSNQDLALAAKRYEELLLSRLDPPFGLDSSLELALSLASELYPDFASLEKDPWPAEKKRFPLHS